jgi:hypothetical protein
LLTAFSNPQISVECSIKVVKVLYGLAQRSSECAGLLAKQNVMDAICSNPCIPQALSNQPCGEYYMASRDITKLSSTQEST